MFWYTLTIIAAVFYGTTFAHVLSESEKEVDSPQDTYDKLKLPGLSWKHYTGTPLPKDAYLVGVRKSDKVGIYVGQVPIDNPNAKVQAVPIYNNTKYVTSTYDEPVKTSENIKILCLDDNGVEDSLTWIPTEDALKYEPDEDFVIVGHEFSKVTLADANLFIGRVTVDDELIVGKVVMGFNTFRFYAYVDGEERLFKHDFEILAYSEAKPKSQEE